MTKGKHRRKSLIGRIIAMRRTSNAAGKHGKYRKDRANTERRAIQEDRNA
jgi:hypothetical protein